MVGNCARAYQRAQIHIGIYIQQLTPRQIVHVHRINIDKDSARG